MNEFKNQKEGTTQLYSGQVHVLHFSGLGFMGLDPGRGPILLAKPCCGSDPHTKTRGRLAQMLAQGQSSLSKKGKIGNRC